MLHPRKKKTGALLLLICFSVTTFPAPLSALEPGETKPQPVSEELLLPQDLGTVQTAVSGRGPWIFHIQTAHGNYEAQKKIQAILHYLEKHYGVRDLLLEGSAYPLQPELLKFFPDRMDLTLEIADDLARKAFVKGPELFLLESPETKAFGIEDAGAYTRNGKSFLEVIGQRENTEPFIRELDLQIERLTSPYLKADLRGFLKLGERFDAGTLPMAGWLEILKKEALGRLEIDLDTPAFQADWPMLFRIFRMKKFEAAIDPETFKKERRAFLKKIRPLLDPAVYGKIKSLLGSGLSQSSLSDPETGLLFETMAAAFPEDFDYRRYPQVRGFIGHLILQSELKSEGLIGELTRLSRAIAFSMADTPEARKVLGLLEDYRLVQRLFLLELLPEDYEKIRKSFKPGRGSRFEPARLAARFNALNGQNRVREHEFKNLDRIALLFDLALDFYRGVKERDGFMLEGIEKRIQARGVSRAAVVTGGFHAGPFREYFEKRGYRYALITPKLTSIEGREAYVESVLEAAAPLKAEIATWETAPFGTHGWRTFLGGFDGLVDPFGAVSQRKLESIYAALKRRGEIQTPLELEGKIAASAWARDLGGIRIFRRDDDGTLRVLYQGPGIERAFGSPETGRAVRSEVRTAPALPGPSGTVRGQALHFWFDADGMPALRQNPEALSEQGIESSQGLGNLSGALREAYALLDSYEKKALFEFQKNNKIKRSEGEWMELPLPVRVVKNLEEETLVTPHEIILNARLLEAPRDVLILILTHGLRRSLYRYEPDRQPHDSEVFQKTLKLFASSGAMRRAWKEWSQTQEKISTFYGRPWPEALSKARELTVLDRFWAGRSGEWIQKTYHQLLGADSEERLRELARQLIPPQRGTPEGRRAIYEAPEIYREAYRTAQGRERHQIYIVYELGPGIRKVVRIAPSDTRDSIASGDASSSRFASGMPDLRLDLVRDPGRAAEEMVRERKLFLAYPKLLEFSNRLSLSDGSKVREALEEAKSILRDPSQPSELQKAVFEMIFSLSKTHPDRALRVELNRFVFGPLTGRPLEFPEATFNYSAFDRDGHTVEVPIAGPFHGARVLWSVNGSETYTAALRDPARVQDGEAWYEWKMPVTEGWVHYAFQVQDSPQGPWRFIETPRDIRDPHARGNGLVKFQEDVRGRRILGLRPEVALLELGPDMKPLVDETGNMHLGTLERLKAALESIKAQGFSEIYLQVLETGAPGEAGPDASPFSPLDQVHISHRIGGLAGLLELKKVADRLGIEIALDMIPHAARANREAAPRTPAWITDLSTGNLVRRAASDGGLSPEWQDGFARNWSHPDNIRDYIAQLSRLAALGFNFRVDVGHVFDTTFETSPETVGMAKIRGEVVTHDASKTLDLRWTWEPSSVMGWITYEVKKAGSEKGFHTKFYAENWHGHEPRLIQSGVDFPFDPLVAIFWNVVRDGRPAHEIVGTLRWLAEIRSLFGGGTLTAIDTHDSHVPPADAFGWKTFAATAAMAFVYGGILFQHTHYLYPDSQGAVDWEKTMAEVWQVYVNNYGPERIVNGQYFSGSAWPGKIAGTDAAIQQNIFLKALGENERRVHELVSSYLSLYPPQDPLRFGPMALDVGHDRVIGAARRVNGEVMVGFFHQGSPYAADINFHPGDARQGGMGLEKLVGAIDDNGVYELVEVFSNEDPLISQENPGDRLVLTGREIMNLGMGPHTPLAIAGSKIFRFKQIAGNLPKSGEPAYGPLLKDSLLRYDRYGPEDRFKQSFVARELVLALEGPVENFSKVFERLVEIITQDVSLEVGDLTNVFGDLVVYRPDLKSKLQEYLINIAVLAREMSPKASEAAIKVLRGADIGEVVLTSPESLWSAGTGGLALAVSDLARELASLGISVTVVTPVFANDKARIFQKFQPRDTGRTLTVKFNADGSESATAKIYETRQDGVRVLYLENDRYFNHLKGKPAFGESAYDGTGPFRLRFARMLSLGTLLAVREMNIHAGIIQTNDWTTDYVKPYLEGRERIDPQLQGLRSDPHLRETRIVRISHNLDRNYHGAIHEANKLYRDDMIRHDLGMDPERDWDILFREGEWDKINPTYTGIKTSDHVLTVSQGYHDRSLDWHYEEEFGGFHNLLAWKDRLGGYGGILNGFGLVQRQKALLGRSFLEMGHENERRHFAREIFNGLSPQFKSQLQEAFRMKPDGPGFEAFVYSMLHRVDPQKGHQLLLGEIWSVHEPDRLKTLGGWFEKTGETVVELSPEDRDRLLNYARENGRESLRAAEAALVLLPDMEILVAGSVSGDFFYQGFSDIAGRFPEQFRFHPQFITMDDPRYNLIYTGSTVFGMPSFFEPGGLSNQEAAAGGVPRHLTRRDGLRDGENRVTSAGLGEVGEGFEPFNPVAWFASLQNLYRLFKEDRASWDELRYKAITQDNRWLRKAKDYVELYRQLGGSERIVGLSALDVASAIHRAQIQQHSDPADELMKAGFTASDAVGITVDSLARSTNNTLIDALVTYHLPALKTIPETASELTQKLQERLASEPDAAVRNRLERALQAFNAIPAPTGPGKRSEVRRASGEPQTSGFGWDDGTRRVFENYREGTLPLRFQGFEYFLAPGLFRGLPARPSADGRLRVAGPSSTLEARIGAGRLRVSSEGGGWIASQEGDLGRVLLDSEILERMADKNPRALLMLLDTLEKLREGQENPGPLLAVVGSKTLYRKIVNALERNQKLFKNQGLDMSERLEAKRFLNPARLKRLIEVIEPSGAGAYVETHERAVVSLLASEEQLSGLPDLAHFMVTLGKIHKQDLAGLPFLITSLLKAAKLVRGLPSAAAQRSALEAKLEMIVPGAGRSGRTFVIEYAHYLERVLVAGRLVDASA